MEAFELFLSLGIAVAAGLLVGLERERSAPSDRTRESFLGGFRTHPLLALAGALSSLLSRHLGPAILAVALAGLFGFLLLSYLDDLRRGADRGITSEAAFLVTFLLGALATSEGIVEPVTARAVAVAAAAVVTTFLLSAKPTLHPLARRVSAEDVSATLKFLIVAVVVLPLLPDRRMGPLQAFNPREIGLMVLLIAGVSFAGYAAIRLLGARRGLGITGLVGGLVSSTAVTISLSSRAREETGLRIPLALAVVLGWTVMFPRLLAMVAVVNAGLVPRLALPLGAMTLAGLAGALVLYRARVPGGADTEVSFSNPFELGHAVGFGLFFAVVNLVAQLATTHLGAAGTYATGLLAGVADADAVTLSMARLARGDLAPGIAVTTVFLAASVNTVVKAVLATTLGGWAYARRLAVIALAMLAAGGIAVALSGR